MSSLSSATQSPSPRYPDLSPESSVPRARSQSAKSARSASPPLPQQPRPATPADLHPWGGKFVQFGHMLSQYTARVQVFFEGLVGLSSPNLELERHDETLAAMAQRLFEIRVLSGEAAGLSHGPMRQDIDAADAFLQSQRTARGYGSRINAGVHGAVSYCKSWFGQASAWGR